MSLLLVAVVKYFGIKNFSNFLAFAIFFPEEQVELSFSVLFFIWRWGMIFFSFPNLLIFSYLNIRLKLA